VGRKSQLKLLGYLGSTLRQLPWGRIDRAAIEAFTGAKFGSSGTLTAARVITAAVKLCRRSRSATQVDVPVMEDSFWRNGGPSPLTTSTHCSPIRLSAERVWIQSHSGTLASSRWSAFSVTGFARYKMEQAPLCAASANSRQESGRSDDSRIRIFSTHVARSAIAVDRHH